MDHFTKNVMKILHQNQPKIKPPSERYGIKYSDFNPDFLEGMRSAMDSSDQPTDSKAANNESRISKIKMGPEEITTQYTKLTNEGNLLDRLFSSITITIKTSEPEDIELKITEPELSDDSNKNKDDE